MRFRVFLSVLAAACLTAATFAVPAQPASAQAPPPSVSVTGLETPLRAHGDARTVTVALTADPGSDVYVKLGTAGGLYRFWRGNEPTRWNRDPSVVCTVSFGEHRMRPCWYRKHHGEEVGPVVSGNNAARDSYLMLIERRNWASGHTVTLRPASTRYHSDSPWLTPDTLTAAVDSDDDGVYDDATASIAITTTQKPAPAPRADKCIVDDAYRKARAAFFWHKAHGSNAPMFWRIINTLRDGPGGVPIPPAGVTEDTISAAEVRAFADGNSWPGWTPIVEAMDCVDGS